MIIGENEDGLLEICMICELVRVCVIVECLMCWSLN